MEFHWIDVPKNSQNFVEKAHYPDSTPLKNSIWTHSIPAWTILVGGGSNQNRNIWTHQFQNQGFFFGWGEGGGGPKSFLGAILLLCAIWPQ